MSAPSTRPDAAADVAPLPSLTTLIADAERLARILEAENAALATHDEAAVFRLLAEKQAACAAFEEVFHRLAEGGANRQQLGTLGERLRRALSDNQRRLSAGIAARKRFLELIAAAVRAQHGGSGTYARSGAPACGHGRGTSVAPSALSFDRSL